MEAVGLFMNKHLAKLWDFMASYNCKSEEQPSDILKAFQECDEALSELDDQCEHWKTMYGNACGDQDVLKESIRLLDTENRRLTEENKDLKEERDRKAEAAVKLAKRRDQLLEENSELKERYQGLRKRHTELFAADNRTIDQLREENESLKKEYKSLQGLNVDIITKRNEEMRQLRTECEDLRKDNEALASAVNSKDDELQVLKKECDELKKDCEYMTNSRNAWRSRAEDAEAERDELKKKLDLTQHAYNGACKDRNCKAEAVVKLVEKRDQLQEALDNIRAALEAKVKRMDEITNDRDTYNSLYAELKKDYVKLSEENKRLNARTDCLRMEVEWYRKHYKKKSDKIQELEKQLEELTSQYQKLTIENKRFQNNVRSGYDQGQTDLWVALQNVNNSQPLELATCFPDVTGVEDILNWDLEDFLDAYKKWWEEKEKERLDHMRDYLARFCEGRLCSGCPLESNEYKCGCGYSFKKANESDTRIIPDEELEKYYEKARGCGAYNLKDDKLFIHDLSHPMAGVNEAIKNACERFTKSVEAANINISTRAWHGDATAEKIKIEPWSCTLEGTINVEFDRDLLEKVCGVKPDDKK